MKYSGYFRRKVHNGVRMLTRDVKLGQAIAQEALVVRYLHALDAGHSEQPPEQLPVRMLKWSAAWACLYRMRISMSDMACLYK